MDKNVTKEPKQKNESIHPLPQGVKTIRYYLIALGIVGISAVAVALLWQFNRPDRLAPDAAKVALNASVENPESIKIRAISKADSVFGRNYVTQQEMTAIGNMMMQASDSISRATNGLETMDLNNPALNSLMTRQMSAMSVMRSMMFDIDDNKGAFSGWRVKIEYEAKGKEGFDYKSEFWAILDKTGQHVIKSFEVPLF